MYGDFTAKWRGLHHVYVQYFGTIPKPSEIKLYTPYNNRECLHCHEGARNFEEGVIHAADADTLAAIKSNKLSCISSGCHDMIHEVGGLEGAKDVDASAAMIDTQSRIDKRLRVSGFLLIAGLSLQALTLVWNHPLSFLAFMFVASPLVLLAIAIYLYAIVMS